MSLSLRRENFLREKMTLVALRSLRDESEGIQFFGLFRGEMVGCVKNFT